MKSIVSTKNPAAVETETLRLCGQIFPGCNPKSLTQAFSWARDCFEGRFRDYQAIDARYHDYEHTLQGTLCFVRLLYGRHRAGAHPAVSESMFRLGLVAILLHDTGYLKKRDDTEGTGAKYTVTHVQRSAEFAAELLGGKGYSPEQIKAVQNMIRCTGLECTSGKISFQNPVEKILGHTLATADLLGQMAAEDYIEKLPILYQEFAEAAQHAGREHFVASFTSADDLKRKTPIFWETFVLGRLKNELEGLYRYLNDPFPKGENDYLTRIAANLRKLNRG